MTSDDTSTARTYAKGEEVDLYLRGESRFPPHLADKLARLGENDQQEVLDCIKLLLGLLAKLDEDGKADLFRLVDILQKATLRAQQRAAKLGSAG